MNRERKLMINENDFFSPFSLFLLFIFTLALFQTKTKAFDPPTKIKCSLYVWATSKYSPRFQEKKIH